MAIIRISGQTSEIFNFQPLMFDEFVPIVEFDRTKFDSASGYLSADTSSVTLSEYIDENLRTITPMVVETENRKIKLPFTLKKGSSKTYDSDGIIDARLSVSDPAILITGNKSFETSFSSSFEVELEIKKTESTQFYLDFYANDNADINEGELKDLHCGRIKIAFTYTVLTDWDTIEPVIPKEKFIGWGHPGVKENCFHYVVAQLKQVGYTVKSPRWNKGTRRNKILNDNIFQLYLEHDVAGMKKGVQKEQFVEGVEYLKKALKDGIPVMAGVDDGYLKVNSDKTTEHFITIVGMGKDEKGKYFTFYDNAVGAAYIDIGTSADNKLYCDPLMSKIEGTGDKRNIYIQGSKKKKYIVTQIRETE